MTAIGITIAATIVLAPIILPLPAIPIRSSLGIALVVAIITRIRLAIIILLILVLIPLLGPCSRGLFGMESGVELLTFLVVLGCEFPPILLSLPIQVAQVLSPCLLGCLLKFFFVFGGVARKSVAIVVEDFGEILMGIGVLGSG